MKNKLEVGMYVRTKHNGIGKIVEYINNPTHYFFKCYKLDRNCFNCEEYITESDVIGEPSHNIIDLIEEGDYVNGHKVSKVVIDSLCSYVLLEEVGSYVDNPDDINEEDIKTIVTKEQFSSMEYELGGKDEIK